MEVGATENPDEEPELELDDDPAHATQVDTSSVPVIVTVSQARPPPMQRIFILPACCAANTVLDFRCRLPCDKRHLIVWLYRRFF